MEAPAGAQPTIGAITQPPAGPQVSQQQAAQAPSPQPQQAPQQQAVQAPPPAPAKKKTIATAAPGFGL